MHTSELELHKLTKNSPDYASTLPRILSLSNNIFNPDPRSKYASVSVWHDRISLQTSLIVYMTPASQETDVPAAFLFAYPRAHDPALSTGHSTSLHIWLAGVSPDYRNNGCLGRMVEELKKNSGQPLTVCTLPSVYPDMWNWLRRREWVVERTIEGEKILLSSP